MLKLMAAVAKHTVPWVRLEMVLQLLLLELLCELLVASIGIDIELFHDFGIGVTHWCLLGFVGVKCCGGDGGVAVFLLLSMELLRVLIVIVA